jgi:MFS transporter, ACS family, D-galactonate transporter
VSITDKRRWTVVALLVLAMVISFFDRGNLAVSAPVLAPQLGLSTWSLGVLLSSFFWTYSIAQIGAGSLVDRLDVRLAYSLGFLLWSAATLSTAMMTSFAGLLGARLILGVGESVTYPATSHILAATVPEARRGLANSLVDLGARLGPALGTFCGALLVQRVGWRGLFLVTGIVGMVWLIPWLLIAPRINAHGNPRAKAISWKELLTRRAVWGTVGGLCGANYAWYFLLSWLPSYLVRERHLSLGSLAVWGSLPYLLMAITSLSGGILADRWIRRGASPIRTRRGFLVSGLSATALVLPATLLPSRGWALAGLLLSCLAFGIYASNLFSLTQTLAGPEAAGRWTGLQNACGNLMGILSSVITGWLVTATGQFAIAFLAASLSCLAGAASFWFLVSEGEAQKVAEAQPRVTRASM